MEANNKNQSPSGWSKELLYQLVDNVKDYAIHCSDLDGLIVSWNVGAEKIFGYKADDIIGQHNRILFTPVDQTKGEAEKEFKTAREKGCAEDERWHVRKDGSFFFGSGVQTPLYDNSGEHIGYAKIARDLTERINYQTEIESAQNNAETKVQERINELANSNEQLRTEVISRKQSESVRSAVFQKIISSVEDERKRIARDLHDNVGQELVGLKFALECFQEKHQNDSDSYNEIEQMKAIWERVDSEVEFLVWELRPTLLDDLGLQKAMRKYVGEWSLHFNIPAEFHESGFDHHKIPSEIEINLYRITQEALNNVAKHARARNVSVLLERKDGKVNLIIEDDGVGFDVEQKTQIREDDRGVGLLGLKERAELVSGTCEIESSKGSGTTIYVRVPFSIESNSSLRLDFSR